MGEAGRGYRCSATSGSHSEGFSSLPTHTLTHICSDHMNCVHMGAHKVHVCTDSLIRTRGCSVIHHVTRPSQPCTHASARKSFKLCKTDIRHFPRRAPRGTCQGQRDDRHAWDWFRGLSLIILCRRLNCLLKSNYQAVCVAYKIGAATRGGEDWKGWERDSKSRGNTLSGCEIRGISLKENLYTRCLETLVYFEWGLWFLCLSSHQIMEQAQSNSLMFWEICLICFLAES